MKIKRAMKTLTAFFGCCLCLAACSKDDNPGDTDEAQREIYQPAKTLTIDQPVMYTADQTITDQALISAYLERRSMAAHFTMDASGRSDEFSHFTLEFREGDKVKMGARDGQVISRAADYILIAEPDTSFTPPDNTDRCAALSAMVPKYNPKVYPVLIENGKYYLPNVVALVTSDTVEHTPMGPVNVTCFKLAKGDVGVFNQQMLTELKAEAQRYDTLVIQTVRRAMVKQ